MFVYLFWLAIGYFVYKTFKNIDVFEQVKKDFYGGNYERPKDFETSLLVLASVIIKADGIINQSELNYVRDYFVRTYGKDKANQSFREFKKVIQHRISTRETCARIGKFMPYPARVQLLKFLFDVALADGHVSASEELEIRKIASYLFINQLDYLRLRAHYFNTHQQQEQQYSSTYSDKSDYHYEVLGLDENATESEIKKAYRTLVKKYHPDRLVNASEQDINIAKEKFQKIQTAYEKIKAERGF